MNTGKLTYIFRKLGLMHALDKLKFNYYRIKNKTLNNHFVSENPTAVIPPDYIMFESFQLNYDKYYNGGRETARWIISKIEEYTLIDNKRILDWGCGPARVIRHLPEVVGNNCQFYGTDYNAKTIKWCTSFIDGIEFNLNDLNPPISYTSDFFDIIYGISIFTHLSEKNHVDWSKELVRILKPKGILVLTSHGEVFKAILTDSEVDAFNTGKLIVRDRAIEGHRVFAAFHPSEYMRNLFESSGLKVLAHEPGQKKDWGIEQDTWFLQKI